MLNGIRIADRSAGRATLAARLLTDLGATVGGDVPLAEADAVLVAGRPSELRARGVDPERLHAAHPRLIVASITPFGLEGPRAAWRACDTVAQAAGGMLLLNGPPDQPPLRALGPQAAHCAGLQAALGIALALLARERCGRGQIVDVSVQEAVVAALEPITGRYCERGEVARRQGALYWNGAFAVGHCADGPVLLSHVGDWTTLLEWLKADGAAQDLEAPRWTAEGERRSHAAHVFDVLDAWARRYRVDDFIERAALLRLPFAPVWPLARAARETDVPWLRRLDEPSDTAPPAAGGGRTSADRISGPRGAAAGLLHGIRVLDFTWVVAGPLATRVLADFGAEVIKVERPDAADGPERDGAMFANLNRGKRSLALDLGTARGREIAGELARRCDVIIDNFTPRVMANWDLGPATLRALNPTAVVVSLSGFGCIGPYADRVSYAPMLHAMAGFTWHMRHPDGAPAGPGFAYADTASGYATALVIAAALWRRERYGGGARLEVTQLGATRQLLAALLADPTSVADAAGNAAPEGAPVPHGVYRCRDRAGERWVAVSIFDDADWARFGAAVGEPWTRDRRYATVAGRRTARDALHAEVAAWARRHDADEIAARLQAAGVSAGALADAADLCGRDPQLAARGYFTRAGTALVDGPMPRLRSTPGAVCGSPPRRGQHGAQLLHEVLGMDDAETDELHAAGVVGRPASGATTSATTG